MTNNVRLFSTTFLGCVLVLAGAEARAGFNVQFEFNDTGGANSLYYDRIRDGVQAAADAWGTYIETLPGQSLHLKVSFTNEATGSGGSAQYGYNAALSQATGVLTYEAGAILKLTRGVDITGAGHDAVLNIGNTWLTKTLWYNPNPGSGQPPPSGQVDSHYFFMHELGHVLGFVSNRDDKGNLPGWQTTFDANTEWIDGNLYYVGDYAKIAYGGKPIPLTYGNFSHYGNSASSGRPGADLVDSVMNGVVSQYKAYELQGVDVAVLADMGHTLTAAGRALVFGSQPPAVPEPASVIALVVGLSGVGAWRAAAGRRRAA